MTSNQPFLKQLSIFETNSDEENDTAVKDIPVGPFFANVDIIRDKILQIDDSSDYKADFICWAMMMKNVDVRAEYALFKMGSGYKKDVLKIYLSPGNVYYWYPTICVNGTSVDMRKASLFLQYLHDYVDGNVTEIQIINQYRKRLRISRLLHRKIIQTLIGSEKKHLKKVFGMDQLCGGCKLCFDLVDNLEEHSLVTWKMLSRGSNTVFNHISVPELLMFQIAQRCMNSTSDKESCMKLLSSFIEDNISVKKLTIPSPRYDGPPVEVLVAILKQWKVRSAVLDVHDFQEYCELGNKKQFFTKFCFGRKDEELSWESTHFIESLTIKFTFSGRVFRQLQELLRNYTKLYRITSKIRKVVSSTQHCAIVFSGKFNDHRIRSNVNIIPCIVNTGNMEKQSNFTMEFFLPLNVAIDAESFLKRLNASKLNSWILSTIASDQERELPLNEQHENCKWEKMRFYNKIRSNWIILHVCTKA
ncbi:hypothetical protein L3Y34_010715 [Caenorhabditis briggsae]|uniref:Uncharacterized protein n=1 Tax=Caenorhabditis briggsae TaxID=6238 RepID=A0AAE9CTG1_CAEBR|nr:hypothetical protein L3Y34_010715 [Caenorhabditis briggsae]